MKDKLIQMTFRCVTCGPFTVRSSKTTTMAMCMKCSRLSPRVYKDKP